MANNSGTINAANVATFPAITPGSAVTLNGGGSGVQSVLISIQNSGWSATLNLYYSPDNVTWVQLPSTSFLRVDTMAFGSVASGVATSYIAYAPPGYVYLVCTNYSSGSISASLTSGPSDGMGVIQQASRPEAVNQETDGTYNYYAFAAPGSSLASSVWKVMRVGITLSTVTWANGNANYSNVGQNLSSLSYS